MKKNHLKGSELLYTGHELRLLRTGRLNNGSTSLLKIPVADTEHIAQAQLSHEYDICRNLDIVGILRPTAKGTVQGLPGVFFQDPGGITLAQLLYDGPMVFPLFFDITTRLIDIISRLHRKGIVHKDIHCGNIIVCTGHEAQTDKEQVYLTGFGIASLQSGHSFETTALNKPEGTLAVMSPEQTGRMNRQVDCRTDFYSLGVVMYQMLTGVLPFAGDDPLALVHAHLAKKPQTPSKINPRIPPMLSELVLKLLSKDADNRYRSAAGIAADLKQCRDDLRRTGTISTFELAGKDVSEAFHIPDKLYGREDEIRTLHAAFERISSGQVELVLVTGYGGIGKTELVNQVRMCAAQNDGYFITGKCDPLNRKIPCAPFVEAMNDTIDQILARPRERIDGVKKVLAQTLGDQGRVLTDVIPMLSLIIGEQPAVASLPPDQAQNRLHLMLQRLFAGIAISGGPAVVFLDDLQWTDFSTLKMLQTLACDSDLRKVLLIGAFRDQEVDEAHALTHTLKEIDTAGGRIQTMALGPMKAEAVQRLISDALNTSPADTGDLATLCHQKTGGNPFFLKRFLLELVTRKLIYFNYTNNIWQWHMEQISRVDVTDNVVELMTDTISVLDDDVQQALKSAACIGGHFDLDTLCTVHGRPPQTLLDDLWSAVQSGLLSVSPAPGLRFGVGSGRVEASPFIASDASLEQIRFAFIHDRIHEAAYGLMTDEFKTGLHLRIGRLLLEKCDQKELDENIFTILGQLNRAATLVTDSKERETLAELNLKAGRRARALAIFESTFDYFRIGIDLLAAQGWQHQYELTKELYLKGIEAAYLSGRHFEMDQWYETAIGHIKTPIEAVNAYIAKIEKEATTTKFFHALDVGRQILAMLGVELPTAPSEVDVQAELAKTEELLACISDDDILDLPDLKDPYHLAMQHVIYSIATPAYWVNRELHDIIILKNIRLMLRHGHSETSALYFAIFAQILSTFREKITYVHRYGQLSIRLMDRYKPSRYYTRTRWTYYIFVSTFYENIRKPIEAFQTIYHEGMASGDFLSAGHSLFNREVFRYFAGEPLDSVVSHTSQARKTVKKTKMMEVDILLAMHQQILLNLMGRSDHRLSLIGDAFDERIHLPAFEQGGNPILLNTIHVHKLILACLFGRFQDAVGWADKVEKDIYYVPNIAIYLCRCHFYIALARLGSCQTNTGQPDTTLLDKAAANQGWLQAFADATPMNFAHLLNLIKAERARVEGRILEAQEYYDQAIELAGENGYPQEQTLASELAAGFLMGRGKTVIARLYMQHALDGYARWGAAAKVNDLQEKHPEFFTETTSETAAVKGNPPTDLDMMSALRASRTISSEIRLDRLVEKLMAVVIENAGATNGSLLLETNETFCVCAEASADQPDQIKRPDKAIAIEQIAEELPLQLIEYVRRTGKSQILVDGAADERFNQDPYFLNNSPRSILCSPIVRKEKLVGMFYLENNLITGAFTDERLKILEILSAQIGVSLENAQLYEAQRRTEQELNKHRSHLEDLVKERTDKLEAANVALAAANASKSDFLARMSHEIRTPLNAVSGLTQIALKTELTEKQREYLSKIRIAGSNLLVVINDILDFSKIEAGRLDLASNPFDLDQIVKQLAALFGDRISQKGLQLRFDVSPDVPRQLIGDGGRVKQILTNLIGNAVKFTEDGEITVTFDLNDELPWDHTYLFLQCTVTDTGIGIEPDILPSLFDPFTQADPSLTRRHEGTGLGLAICRQLIHLMGGNIRAESTPGKGTVFSFSVKLETARELPETLLPGYIQESVPVPIRHLAGRRVLIVEDSTLNREVAIALLEEAGLLVETAENGLTAVEMVTATAKGYYNGVLMDIQMPVMDGYEATRRIRKFEMEQDLAGSKAQTPTPIIALTAHALKGEKERCLAAGMDDYLSKPLDEQALHQILRKWLTKISHK